MHTREPYEDSQTHQVCMVRTTASNAGPHGGREGDGEVGVCAHEGADLTSSSMLTCGGFGGVEAP